ncbi:hypothetical protein MRX96_003170 [Rhipicephalus microplus]
MDSTTPAAKSRRPFRPPGCSNLGAVSPVSDCQSFLAQRQWFYRSPRKTHIAINTSMADAMEGRRRGCLETRDDLETWSTQRLGPKWVSSTEIEQATGVDIADGEVAVIRHRRHVSATNTRCLLDADRVKLKGEARRRCWSSVELRNLPTCRQHRRMRAYELHGLAPILLNDVNITLKQEGTDSKDHPRKGHA